MGIRERRPDAPSVVLAAADSTSTGGAKAPSETQGSTRHEDRSISHDMSASRSAHCTTRHVATRTLRGQLWEREPRLSGSAGLQPGSRTEVNAKARSHPRSSSRQERTEDGWRRKRDEPEQPSSGDKDPLHAQRAEGRESGAGRPPDHAQHVNEACSSKRTRGLAAQWTGEQLVGNKGSRCKRRNGRARCRAKQL